MTPPEDITSAQMDALQNGDNIAAIEARSWAPEVFLEGHWSGNGLRFATKKEAEQWGDHLLMRWFVPTDSRAVPSQDPVNYRLKDDGQLEEVKP